MLPDEEPGRDARPAPTGFAAMAGALADCSELDHIVDEIYAERRKAADRPPPGLD